MNSTGHFKATFDGQPIFDELNKLESGGGQFIVTRLWELQAQIELGLSDEEYAALSVQKRARVICTMNIRDWLSALDGHKINQRGKK